MVGTGSPASSLALIPGQVLILAAEGFTAVIVALPADGESARSRLDELRTAGFFGILCCPSLFTAVASAVANQCPLIALSPWAAETLLGKHPVAGTRADTPIPLAAPIQPAPTTKPIPVITPVVVAAPTPVAAPPPAVELAPLVSGVDADVPAALESREDPSGTNAAGTSASTLTSEPVVVETVAEVPPPVMVPEPTPVAQPPVVELAHLVSGVESRPLRLS